MNTENPCLKLARYILPEEIASHFELTDVKEVNNELHFYLEEKAEILEGYTVADLQPYDFYQDSQIQHFPVPTTWNIPVCILRMLRSIKSLINTVHTKLPNMPWFIVFFNISRS